MGKTNIAWASHTVNFYDWACRQVSPGCKNCYARAMAQRYGKNFDKTPEWRDKAAAEFLNLPAGAVAFINSMSDTWHEDVPLETVLRIYDIAARRPDVTCLILTKRIARWVKHERDVPALPNVWAGTSVESSEFLFRLRTLRRVPAAGHFVSAEPLIRPLIGYFPVSLEHELERGGIDWIITGAESGPNRRPFDPQWVRDIRDSCALHNVTFMHKQGSAFKPGQDRELDGRTHDDTPDFAAAAARFVPPPWQKRA